jgi:DNA-binding transcriptional regulator PaaX
VKRKITLVGILKLINDFGEEMFPMDRISAYRRFYAPKYFDMEDYFPSKIISRVKKLEGKGWIEVTETHGVKEVAITKEGKKQIMAFDLKSLRPKPGKWDGKWRMVIFDIEERKRLKRDYLRKYLSQLGFKEIQKSVYISPFDCENELHYLKEILDVGEWVRIGLLEKIENESELKIMFGLE